MEKFAVHQGSMDLRLTTAGKEFVDSIFNQPRKTILILGKEAMEKLRELKPGQIIDFNISSGDISDTRKYKITRRDWKRCKVYMLEVRE